MAQRTSPSVSPGVFALVSFVFLLLAVPGLCLPSARTFTIRNFVYKEDPKGSEITGYAWASERSKITLGITDSGTSEEEAAVCKGNFTRGTHEDRVYPIGPFRLNDAVDGNIICAPTTWSVTLIGKLLNKEHLDFTVEHRFHVADASLAQASKNISFNTNETYGYTCDGDLTCSSALSVVSL